LDSSGLREKSVAGFYEHDIETSSFTEEGFSGVIWRVSVSQDDRCFFSLKFRTSANVDFNTRNI
jgi:hypothetical protein